MIYDREHEQLLADELPPESFFIHDFSEVSQAAFFAFLYKHITLIPQDMPSDFDTSGDFGIATLDYIASPYHGGVLVSFAEIFVNMSAFFFNGEDFSDLMEITILHEMVECWVNLFLQSNFPGIQPTELAEGVGHETAVKAEFQRAIEKGEAERYLLLTRWWAEQMASERAVGFLRENEAAFQFAQSSSVPIMRLPPLSAD